jgi:hypothetical protein
MICKEHTYRISLWLVYAIVFVGLFSFPDISKAQTLGDSSLMHQQSPDERNVGLDDDFSPGLFFLALTGLMLAVVFTIFICALTLAAVLFLFALIAGGVISASILYGLHRKSLEEGFRAFCILFFTISGFIGLTIVFYLFNTITHWWVLSVTLVMGGVSGILAGYLTGKLMFYAMTKLISRFKIWYEKRNPDYFSNS